MKSKPILIILLVIFVIVDLVVLGIILIQRGLFSSSSGVSPDFAENINVAEDTDAVQNTNTLLNANSSPNKNASKNTNSVKNANLSQNVNANVNAATSKSTTYTSEGLGLTLELPAIFHTTDIFTSQDDFFQAETYDPSQYTYTDALIIGLKLEIYLAENPQNLDLLDWIANQGYEETEPSFAYTQTTVGGKKALESETLTKMDAVRDIFVASGDKVYIIFLTGDRASYDDNNKIIQNMINSITFTK